MSSEVPSWLNEENISTAAKVAQNPAARNAAKTLAANAPPPPPPPPKPASKSSSNSYVPPGGGDVESQAAAPAANDPSSEFIIEEATLKSMQNWHMALRIAYMLASSFMAVMAGLSLQNQKNLGLIFFALYVIFFGGLIWCFEFNLRLIARGIAENFGFMYTLYGRWCFLLFVGFMSFSLGTLGIVAMCGLYVAGIFHIYIMWRFPRFEEYLRKKHYFEGKYGIGSK